jgi:hypothetical protein
LGLLGAHPLTFLRRGAAASWPDFLLSMATLPMVPPRH